MKLTSILLTLGGLLILTGCETPNLLSFDPVVVESDVKGDAALPGAWEESADKGTVCLVRQGERNSYKLYFMDNASVVFFEAKVFRVKDAEFLDIVPEDDNDFRIPAHSIARIWTGGTLRWAFLDSDWLKKQAESLSTKTYGSKLLLLSPGETVRSFIEKYGLDDKAYGKQTTWQRMQ